MITEEIAYEIKDLWSEGKTDTEVRLWLRARLGLGKSQANYHYKKWFEERAAHEIEASGGEKKLEPDLVYPQVEILSHSEIPIFKVDGNKAEISAENVKTLEDLVALAKIDLNEWEAVKNSVGTYNSKVSFKAEFKKRELKQDFEEILNHFKEESAKHAPLSFNAPKQSKTEKLLVFNLCDLHANKRSNNKETGHEDYNLGIAVRMFEETVENLLAKSLEYTDFSKILFIAGNDLFNADGISGQTTGFTQQDNDKSWFEGYKTVCKLITDSIEKLASVASVDVIVCPGNHDTQSCFTLGEYLTAWFKNNDDVNVFNDPKPRKYYRYFSNLFCITHGNEEKPGDLPLTMAAESKDWSDCLNREVWLGHTHQLKIFEDKGVVVRTFPSLSASDLWHSKKAYVGNHRVGQALIYNKEGLDAMFQYKPSFN